MAPERFALPLTTYERNFWRNDRPGYPPVFSVWLQLRGDIDEGVFDRALEETIARHPLLGAVISGSGLQARWMPRGSIDCRVEWCSDARVPIEPPDLAREAGLRVVGSKREEAVDLIFHFHHAACDGVGGIEFLGDLFSAYSQLLAGGSGIAPVRELDSHALGGRSVQAGSLPATLSGRLGRRARLTARLVKALGFRPSTMAADPEPGSGGRLARAEADALYRLPGAWLDQEQVRSLRDLARVAGASLNDLLLAEVLLAIGRWNAETRGGGNRIRLLMPTNLRTAEHAGLPAANVVGFEPIDRRVAAVSDWWALLAGIREETAAVKLRRQLSWVDESMGAFASRPRLLDALLRFSAPLYTGVLSNLGTPSDHFWSHLPQAGGRVLVGQAILVGIGFAPPVQQKASISLGIIDYGGRLNITGKACPATIGAAGLERFLELLAGQLQARAGEQPKEALSATG